MSELFAIGAGHDVPYGSLTLVTNLVIPGSEPFGMPLAIPLWSDGDIRVRLDYALDPRGYPDTAWLFGFMYWPQYTFLRTTYCNGGLSGEVTIYTTVEGGESYERLNATMWLPTPAEISGQNGHWYKETKVRFVDLQAAA